MKKIYFGAFIYNEEVDIWLLEQDDDLKSITKQVNKTGSIQGYGLAEYTLSLADQRKYDEL
jgi:hypothetical protein